MPLVVFKKGRLRAFTKILNQIEQKGLNLNVVMYCESSDALKSSVRAGMGLGLSYSDLVQPEVKRQEFKVIQFPGLMMRSESYVVYHKEKPLSDNAKVFLVLLRQQTQMNRQVDGSSTKRDKVKRDGLGLPLGIT